jgi:hypothetical protein
MFDDSDDDTDVDHDENEYVRASAGADTVMNPTLFCHSGLRVPVMVLGGTPHYNVQALLRGLVVAGPLTSASAEDLALMRLSRLCEKLDDAGVKYRQDSRGDMHLRGHELVKALQYGWIRGLTSASTTAMALLGDLVTHMAGAFESLLNVEPEREDAMDVRASSESMLELVSKLPREDQERPFGNGESPLLTRSFRRASLKW